MARLLDLFCGGGGAAWGYHLAGFDDIVGVDNRPQPHYPFRFEQGDALECLAAHGQEYDAVHASPPCQAYSALKHLARGDHPKLIEDVRGALQATGRPYVIENVVGAPLHFPLMLCGSMFGLETDCGAQLRRHRLFESSVLLMAPGHCRHGEQRADTISACGDTPHNPRLWRAEQRGMKPATISIHGDPPRDRRNRWGKKRTIMVVGATPRDPAAERVKYKTITVTGSTPQQNAERNMIRETFSIEQARKAMGIDWRMPMRELSQAIPPAYTHWIGRQLMQWLERKETQRA